VQSTNNPENMTSLTSFDRNKDNKQR